MPIAITVHLLAAIIWIGGMFFAYVCLRPSLPAILQAPQPAQLWHAVLGRFFRWVWIAVAALLLSGLWMAFTRYGSISAWPYWLLAMFVLGLTMMLLFMHAFFAPYKRLAVALIVQDAARATHCIGQIRRLVAINLVLGFGVVIITAAGRAL
jgi:uncharacterized membrane protein